MGTVFLGAFLAFGLENLRERRQLRAWANDYLKRVRCDLKTEKDSKFRESVEQTAASYTAFVEQVRSSHQADEKVWSSLLSFHLSFDSNYQALLEGSAVRVLPAELVRSLGEREERKRADARLTELSYTVWQQYAVPIALIQALPDETEQRGLELVQVFLRARLGNLEERLKIETQVLELLDKHNFRTLTAKLTP